MQLFTVSGRIWKTILINSEVIVLSKRSYLEKEAMERSIQNGGMAEAEVLSYKDLSAIRLDAHARSITLEKHIGKTGRASFAIEIKEAKTLSAILDAIPEVDQFISDESYRLLTILPSSIR